MKACVVIPTYNEAKTIAGLIEQLRKQGLDVLVVDDGSSDNTYNLARQAGSAVLRNQNNQGKGASLVKGFNYALSHGYDVVITMDGDGQHLPADIPYFIRMAEDSKSGLIIGNRMLKTQRMPRLRLLTNMFMSWVISKVAGQGIPDTQCGFRLLKKEVIEKLSLGTSKYETESEIIIQTSRLGFKIESMPVKTVYAGEKSQINPFIDTLRFFKFILRELWTIKP
ncbi:MAG: glycosyltransferase family 2 protein [Candidatus Omnitrophica bacterium]|nr:glycosyltransferase family 2 protein [Candidatus Omnitrophota bacterium]